MEWVGAKSFLESMIKIALISSSRNWSTHDSQDIVSNTDHSFRGIEIPIIKL